MPKLSNSQGLLASPPGAELLLLGNEAIALGALEAGVGFAAAYPGTPSSEISATLLEASRTTDLYFELSTNEKVALEAAAAASHCGVRSMTVMKHVGMNVACDFLVTLAYVGVEAGLVIVSADDPGMFSSQNEQDNRLFGRLALLPVLEPSSPEEARRMTAHAFELSERLGEPVILRTTTRLNHASGVVTRGEIPTPVTTGAFAKDPERKVAIPAVSRRLHERLLANATRAEELAATSDFNFVEGEGAEGIVVSGVGHNYVSDALTRLGLADRFRVLRLGFTHPLPRDLVADFLGGCRKVLVVEEGEPVLEEAVRVAAQERGLSLPVEGKGFAGLTRIGEYGPALVRGAVAELAGVDPGPVAPELEEISSLPHRPPRLCAGCSHRATYHVVREACAGEEVVFASDIGCYTLGYQPPFSMADMVVCMGASTGLACGLSRASSGSRTIAFIGDSTFYHSGVSGLINAVFNRHDFTLVILDNGTTAMTGHQHHPGTDMERLGGGDDHQPISLEEVVGALGVRHVSVIKPYEVARSVAAVKEAIAHPGVSVVIARELCALYAAKVGEPGKGAFTVTHRCSNDRHCIETLACPAFYVDGGKVCIDADLCTGCSLCAQVCPERAIRKVGEE